MKLVRDWWLPDGEVAMVEWFKNDSGYQRAHRKEALRHVTNWTVAVDIGAHVGTWSKDMAEKFEEVHAFEPVEAHRECFKRNVTAGNVTLHPYALGQWAQSVGMDVGKENSGHSVVSGNGTVQMLTLDSFEFENVGYIKLDCEGYEVFALKGGEETLKRCRPVVSVEQKKSAFGPQYAALDYLASLGMKELGRVHDDIVLGW